MELSRFELSELFRQAPAFIAILRGPDHVFELTNDAYLQLVGHRDVVGKSVAEAIPEARDHVFIRLLDEVVRSGQAYIGNEMPMMLQPRPGAPPESRFLNFIYQPLTDDAGGVSGIFVHGVDVTEQVRARQAVDRLNDALREQTTMLESQADALQTTTEELRRARAEAEAANKSKSDFLAVMSHELRTPLNAIGGYAQLLSMGIRGPVTDAQHVDLEKIQRSQRHLLGLIGGILNYAKIDAGAVQYDIENVALAEVLNVCEALTLPQLREKSLHLERTNAAGECVALADREKVQQILLNLLSNAIKFTDAGGSITLTCTVEGEWVVVRVRDTGRGIAAAQLDRVFEPFIQIDARFTRDQTGTGLGLAISRELARGMDGDLTAQSESGVGSVFTLQLRPGQG